MTRILIIDDQPSFRRHLRQLLTMAGLEVVGEAGDIAEAEALAETLCPELAVIDVMLPGVSGLEGTLRLKALLPNLRVILVSAYTDQADVFGNAARDVGAEAFIPKDNLDVNIVAEWKRPT